MANLLISSNVHYAHLSGDDKLNVRCLGIGQPMMKTYTIRLMTDETVFDMHYQLRLFA